MCGNACARAHRPDGPKANHALTVKLDHSGGAAQIDLPQRCLVLLVISLVLFDNNAHLRKCYMRNSQGCYDK